MEFGEQLIGIGLTRTGLRVYGAVVDVNIHNGDQVTVASLTIIHDPRSKQSAFALAPGCVLLFGESFLTREELEGAGWSL